MARKGGWRRAGSRGRSRYLDGRRNRIDDPAKIERIESLVIPPAWKDVWCLTARRREAAGDRVIEQYLDGRTIEDFRPRHLRVVKARDIGLEPEESALVGLLRSWRMRRTRKAA